MILRICFALFRSRSTRERNRKRTKTSDAARRFEIPVSVKSKIHPLFRKRARAVALGLR
jgi:ribosomal protein L31